MPDPVLSFNLDEVVQSYLENDRGEEVLAILQQFLWSYTKGGAADDVPVNLRSFVLKNALSLGDVYYHIGHTQEAIRYYEMSVLWGGSWGEETNAHTGHITTAIARLGLSFIRLHELDRGRALLESAGPFFRRVAVDLRPDKVVFLLATALLHALEGNIEQHATYLRKATKQLRQIGPLPLHRLWELRGVVLEVLRVAKISECGEDEGRTGSKNASVAKRDAAADQLPKALRALLSKESRQIPEEVARMVQSFGTVNLPDNLRPFLFQSRLDDARSLYGAMHEEFGVLLLKTLAWHRTHAAEIAGPLTGPALTWREACERFAAIEASIVHDRAWPGTEVHLRSTAFNVFLGEFAAALRHVVQIVAIENRWIEQFAPTQSADNRRRLLGAVRLTNSLLVSLVGQNFRRDEKAIQLAFDLLARRRSVDLETRQVVRELIHESSVAEVAEQYEELSRLNDEIARYAYQGMVGTKGVSGLRMVENARTRAQQAFPDATFASQNDAFRIAYMLALKMNLETALARRTKVEEALGQLLPKHSLEKRVRGSGERIQKALPARTCLIDIVRVRRIACDAACDSGRASDPEEAYVAFVCSSNRPGRMALIDLGTAGEIDAAVHELRCSITRRDEPIITNAPSASDGPTPSVLPNHDPNEYLYGRLIDAVAEWLDGCSTVYICPDSELARIPFEVLKTVDGRYLAESVRIVYLSSAREILTWGRRVMLAEAPAVIADVNFDLEGDPNADDEASGRTPPPSDKLRDAIRAGQLEFRPLKATRREGEVVAQLIGARRIFGDDATSPAVRKLRSPKILHICTHGYFLPKPVVDVDEWGFAKDGLLKPTTGWLRGVGLEDPFLRSGLALAGANTWLVGNYPAKSAGSGFLTAENLGYMDLAATELVTLSACDTGLGDIDVGEGVLGLRHSVVAAGARSLVLSLWKVSDEETCAFMETFYQELCNGKDRVDALRIAQARIREDYSDDPYYWGAFICQGYPGPIRREDHGAVEGHEEPAGKSLIARNVFASRVSSGYAAGSLDHLRVLAKRAGMIFRAPTGFEEVSNIDHDCFQADYALKSEHTAIEILYGIRPESDYPEQFGTSDFLTFITDLSDDQNLSMGEFPRDAVRREFGADWGLHAAFRPAPSFRERVLICNAVAVHKDGSGTAIILYMIGEAAAMQMMLSVFECLQFQRE